MRPAVQRRPYHGVDLSRAAYRARCRDLRDAAWISGAYADHVLATAFGQGHQLQSLSIRFSVVCLAMLLLTAFEAVFSLSSPVAWCTSLTTRLDVKLSTYMFEKVLNLPIDYFERTQIGRIARDIREICKIRTFLVGQLFGTILDLRRCWCSLPMMFFFSPMMTFAGPGVLRSYGGLASPHAARLSQAHRRGAERRGRAGLVPVSDH